MHTAPCTKAVLILALAIPLPYMYLYKIIGNQAQYSFLLRNPFYNSSLRLPYSPLPVSSTNPMWKDANETSIMLFLTKLRSLSNPHQKRIKPILTQGFLQPIFEELKQVYPLATLRYGYQMYNLSSWCRVYDEFIETIGANWLMDSLIHIPVKDCEAQTSDFCSLWQLRYSALHFASAWLTKYGQKKRVPFMDVVSILTHFPHPLSANLHGAFWMYWLMNRHSYRAHEWWKVYLMQFDENRRFTGRFIFDIFHGIGHGVLIGSVIDYFDLKAYSECMQLAMNAWDTVNVLPFARDDCSAAPTREFAQNCAFGMYHALVDLDVRGYDLPVSVCTGFALTCWIWLFGPFHNVGLPGKISLNKLASPVSKPSSIFSAATCVESFALERDVRACVFHLTLAGFPGFQRASRNGRVNVAELRQITVRFGLRDAKAGMFPGDAERKLQSGGKRELIWCSSFINPSSSFTRNSLLRLGSCVYALSCFIPNMDCRAFASLGGENLVEICQRKDPRTSQWCSYYKDYHLLQGYAAREPRTATNNTLGSPSIHLPTTSSTIRSFHTYDASFFDEGLLEHTEWNGN